MHPLVNLSLCAIKRATSALATKQHNLTAAELLTATSHLLRLRTLEAKPLRRLSAHALIGLYHSTQPTPNPEDRLVAYGNAVQSWLLSPDATTSRTLLSDLNLPQLTYGALRRAGYTYADEVSGLADAQLLTVRNLGPKGVSLLREALSRHTA
jgi:hypothetical protein